METKNKVYDEINDRLKDLARMLNRYDFDSRDEQCVKLRHYRVEYLADNAVELPQSDDAKTFAFAVNREIKNKKWEGCIAIPFDEDAEGRLCTVCPYGEKTPKQKMEEFFKHGSRLFTTAANVSCAFVGSKGCASCWYNLGYAAEHDNVLLCGFEGGLTLVSIEDEDRLIVERSLSEPRLLD